MSSDNTGHPRVHKQHLISKVLLRRFADRSGNLQSFDLKHGASRPRHPSQVGWRHNFVEHESAAMEALWAQVELRLSAALDDVENGTVFDRHESSETLRIAIALHFMRRDLVKSKFDALHTSSRERAQADARRRGFEAEADLAGEEFEAERDETFSEVLRDLFGRAERLAADSHLEVVTSRDTPLVLGDFAVLSMNSAGGVGFIPFAAAATHILPVGPHHMVALASADDEFDISSEHAEQLNEFQLVRAQQHAFYRPDARTKQWIERIVSKHHS